MNFTLKAFGQSEKYTIRERAERVLYFHKIICEMLGHFEWKIYNKKTALIDIRNFENAYTEIYAQVKKGLNAKVVKPIRYNEDDIADITSSCNFYNTIKDSFDVEYSLGYPSDCFPAFRFGITNMKSQEFFNKDKIREIVDLVIKTWKPEMLCVTNPDFFHSISKTHKNGTPWSGWFTYVAEYIEPKQNEIITKGLDISRIEIIDNFGKIYWVTDEMFEERNKEHILKALSLENYFMENNIKMTWRQ